MSEFFVGQIMLAGFKFAPRYFALCDGQLLPINQNQALFSLLGTQFGGNGTTTFALPDMRGRTPVAAGSSADPAWQPTPYAMGERGGLEAVPLTDATMPVHGHTMQGTSAAGAGHNPAGALYGNSGSENLYGPSSGPQVTLAPQSIGMTGSGLPHENMQPYRVINFAIALQGIFPSRN